MKLTIKKAAISAAIAGALLLAAPAAAQAYVPTTPGTQTVTITADGPVTFNGYAPNTSITFTLVGYNADAAGLATANLPVSSKSITKTSDASGAATAVVTLPADARGSYTLSASGTTSGGGSSTGGSASGGSGSGSTSDASNGLAVTGMDANSLLGLWVGGGALVLAGGTVAMATTIRRNRAQTKA